MIKEFSLQLRDLMGNLFFAEISANRVTIVTVGTQVIQFDGNYEIHLRHCLERLLNGYSMSNVTDEIKANNKRNPDDGFIQER